MLRVVPARKGLPSFGPPWGPTLAEQQEPLAPLHGDPPYVGHSSYAALGQTKDGGNSWRTELPLGETEAIRPMAASFSDPQHGWVVSKAMSSGNYSILATDGGGQTWWTHHPCPARLICLRAVKRGLRTSSALWQSHRSSPSLQSIEQLSQSTSVRIDP